MQIFRTEMNIYGDVTDQMTTLAARSPSLRSRQTVRKRSAGGVERLKEWRLT